VTFSNKDLGDREGCIGTVVDTRDEVDCPFFGVSGFKVIETVCVKKKREVECEGGGGGGVERAKPSESLFPDIPGCPKTHLQLV